VLGSVSYLSINQSQTILFSGFCFVFVFLLVVGPPSFVEKKGSWNLRASLIGAKPGPGSKRKKDQSQAPWEGRNGKREKGKSEDDT